MKSRTQNGNDANVNNVDWLKNGDRIRQNGDSNIDETKSIRSKGDLIRFVVRDRSTSLGSNIASCWFRRRYDENLPRNAEKICHTFLAFPAIIRFRSC